jgi:hypothetical protein
MKMFLETRFSGKEVAYSRKLKSYNKSQNPKDRNVEGPLCSCTGFRLLQVFFYTGFTILVFKEVPWVMVEFETCRSHPFRCDQIIFRLS